MIGGQCGAWTSHAGAGFPQGLSRPKTADILGSTTPENRLATGQELVRFRPVRPDTFGVAPPVRPHSSCEKFNGYWLLVDSRLDYSETRMKNPGEKGGQAGVVTTPACPSLWV